MQQLISNRSCSRRGAARRTYGQKDVSKTLALQNRCEDKQLRRACLGAGGFDHHLGSVFYDSGNRYFLFKPSRNIPS